jgi:hypothetical protein
MGAFGRREYTHFRPNVFVDMFVGKLTALRYRNVRYDSVHKLEEDIKNGLPPEPFFTLGDVSLVGRNGQLRLALENVGAVAADVVEYVQRLSPR